MTRFDWPDLEYTATCEPTEVAPDHVVDFAIYHWEDTEDDGTPHFWIKGESSNFKTTPEPANAEPVIVGAIKWNGCCNWSVDGSVHTCSRSGAVSFTEALLRAMDEAFRMVKRRSPDMYDGDYGVGSETDD